MKLTLPLLLFYFAIVFMGLYMGACSVTYYSTPQKGLIHVRVGDSKLKGVEATVDGSELKVESSESEGNVSGLGTIIKALGI